MTAILFGSISTVADTSELQREAFNKAFQEHGLDWTWDRDDYRERLQTAGGRQRIAAYAAERNADVDADAVHATKSRIFQESLAGSGLQPRPGVADVVKAARDRGVKLGLVTTTVPENVAALLSALQPAVQAADFDVIVDLSDVENSKPAPDAYQHALRTLGEDSGNAVAIEDNPDGVASAAAAGIAVAAFPNENTAGHEFPEAARTVSSLRFDELEQLAA